MHVKSKSEGWADLSKISVFSRSSIPHLEYDRLAAGGSTTVSGTDRQSLGCLCSETATLYHSRGCSECYPGAGVLPVPKQSVAQVEEATVDRAGGSQMPRW